ncbi:MAG: NfeD family protein [Gammaproteobacteria bacterium]|nr:NfeD family protein [Gammaproteobacteria bacterium]
MTWWGWIIAGAVLLGAELTLVSAQFYLVFIGSAAILVGLITLVAPPADWAQWALFAVLAIVSMVAFRNRLYQRFRGAMPQVDIGPRTGGVITLQVPLGAGESCQTEYGGSYWTILNDGDRPIPSGGRARVTGVKDLTLLVKPDG